MRLSMHADFRRKHCVDATTAWINYENNIAHENFDCKNSIKKPVFRRRGLLCTLTSIDAELQGMRSLLRSRTKYIIIEKSSSWDFIEKMKLHMRREFCKRSHNRSNFNVIEPSIVHRQEAAECLQTFETLFYQSWRGWVAVKTVKQAV